MPLVAQKEAVLDKLKKSYCADFFYKALSALFLLLIYTLLCGCNTSPEKNYLAPGEADGSSTAEQDYLVVPLTHGEVSPISACSYDLLHTVCTIQLYDSTDYDLLNSCFSLIHKYEKIFSRTLEDSEIYRINHSTQTSFEISDELRDILEFALSYGELSNGALDISIAPISALWDFSGITHKAAVPEHEALAAALSLVDYRAIRLEGNTLTFAKTGMQLELGAVAKGYIADRVKDYLLANGVTSAIINLGGNILLVGEKTDGTAFRVGIQKPFENRDAVVAAISELKDCSMVSSGIYERYFYDEEGTFYHHILNPATGYPYDSSLQQVTIISKDSATGDALSTACFALGLEKGMELIHSLTDVYAVFITSDGALHFSDGFLETIPTQTE